ncbi:DUF3179 domain-containing protein [Halorarius halobius]|uniref:DUF3179 domain-containing protein n=1 Tax=Halorarius halobius TaxID=2962671 RepID=UPI0020CEC1DB|nr:DUF3179 domain-containing protein [Halorarius halobius]
MQRLVTRRAVLAGVGVASLSGCIGSRQPGTPGDTSASGAPEEGGQSRTGENMPPTKAEQLLLPMEPSSLREHAVSGGPPKDGIPSIDEPKFVSAEDVSGQIKPDDPVFGLATEGTVKAYPQSILVLHEICNDIVDNTPVSVTYCPLTGTAMGFERGETMFGVSGRLVNNNLIMYDRATETWWPQVLATSIPGSWNEDPPIRSLQEFRVIWTTWERWVSKHPDTQVLSRDTGYAQNYDRDPYGSYNPRGGYYSQEAAPMFPALSDDDRLQPKTVVIGARTNKGAAAFEKRTLRETKLIEGKLGETPVVAIYEPELDTGYVYQNPERQQVQYQDGHVVDGAGDTHSPEALPLERIHAFDAMWFAWSGFYPDTTLYA